ncbi:fibroblast growth factor-binding protein 3 [Hemiscyllium ocellatum]|uniref:fibroblast growth factor-binding protein 3 n=1 Tax=Hemiscyllium ocellatum TaxID=170820 RepID=UPI002966F081|nr:fibroblast growth factor-binding protein 3 [Hemiscyllium ocellatum]
MRCFWELAVLLLVLYLIYPPGAGAKGGDGKEQVSRPRRKGKGKPVPSKGALTTRQGHECSWEVQGQEELTLQLSCTHQGRSYWCQYSGVPHSCLTYNSRAAQYWKQVLSKVKKKRHACQGDSTLKAKVCKQGPPESQLRLQGEGQGRRRLSGSARQKEPPSASPERAVPTPRARGTAGDKPKGWDPAGSQALSEMNDDRPGLHGDLAQVYCTEKWHSLCSFFVGLWNG